MFITEARRTGLGDRGGRQGTCRAEFLNRSTSRAEMGQLARLRGVWRLALVSRGAVLGKLRPFWAIFDAGPVDFTICVLLVAIGGM